MAKKKTVFIFPLLVFRMVCLCFFCYLLHYFVPIVLELCVYVLRSGTNVCARFSFAFIFLRLFDCSFWNGFVFLSVSFSRFHCYVRAWVYCVQIWAGYRIWGAQHYDSQTEHKYKNIFDFVITSFIVSCLFICVRL